jgi:hypothetical protein
MCYYYVYVRLVRDIIGRAKRGMKRSARIASPRSAVSFGTPTALTEAEPYVDRLNRDKEWAMDEGERFFQGTSKTHQALKKIAGKLNELGIDYVIVGGMAMFQHGYRRFTEDVDLLVTREGLKEIHRALEGLGYRPPFDGSKHLRDTEHGVKIEFLVTGDFPGDGKPKPVAFPTPATVADEINGIRYINLPSLVELKLASGMTNVGRMKDLGDVTEMITVLELPRDFADKLNPFVQEKYRELWDAVHPVARRYAAVWPIKGVVSVVAQFNEVVAALESSSDTFRAMLADGVTPDPVESKLDDCVYLTTSDPAVARKYDMHDESEFWHKEQEIEDEHNG